MTTATSTSVVVETEVGVPPERAFEVFTSGMETWWDPQHHLSDAPVVRMEVQPFVGGRIVDHASDGTTCAWSRVLAWEPPARFVFSWDIDLRWQLEPDPSRTSEIEVTFTAVSPDRTRVVLTHRHLDRHGEGWEAMATAVGSGWSLDAYAAATA
ncbi:SRPBCC family protein [Lapillicoccus jejuensis]|uniref:Uncharacterized protein YndB with AHSA1/START domain n=1 Tax=Lapillicoccus jejuensis TaxID=402171 RepID=A0A542DXY9_9MICO|nr:SRPBCC family protein [Lapillicoccus jejuensis]TQJ07948.1 uncharacterized protein YndB with AHSA1/START domain [Lapillicoccus jejuensis]